MFFTTSFCKIFKFLKAFKRVLSLVFVLKNLSYFWSFLSKTLSISFSFSTYNTWASSYILFYRDLVRERGFFKREFVVFWSPRDTCIQDCGVGYSGVIVILCEAIVVRNPSGWRRRRRAGCSNLRKILGVCVWFTCFSL